MHVGSHGHSHGFGQHRLSESAQMMRREMAADGPTRGERIVARLDGDGDGAIGAAELADTKLGRRMSVDRFARMDANEDGRLDAGELDAGRRRGHDRHHHGPGMMENVVQAQYADYLAEKVETDDGPAEVAARVIEKLDGDQSGALNSEEIAGTRLAGLVAGDFHQIDVDKNGALDREELAGFVTDHLSGGSDGGDPVPASTDGATAEPAVTGEAAVSGDDSAALPAEAPATAREADPAAEPATGDGAGISPADAVAGSGSGAAARAESIASAFEAALEILQGGAGAADPYDVVQALYGDVQTILASG